MNKLIFLMYFIIQSTLSFAQPSYLGQWASSDTSSILEFTSDSLFIYEFDDDCYEFFNFSYQDIGNNTLSLGTIIGNVPITYSFDSINNVLTIINPEDTSILSNFTFDITQYEPCVPIAFSDYLGQWTNTDTTYLEITVDSIFIHEFIFGCYNTVAFSYEDQGGGMFNLNIGGQVVQSSYSLTNNNQNLSLLIDGDTLVFSSNSFDLSLYVPCASAWACNTFSGSCIENAFGQFGTEAECIASCINNGGASLPYIGQWINSSDSTEFIQITSDSIFIYEFEDSCYNVSSLTYIDSSNNNLFFTTIGQTFLVSYTMSNNDSILELISPFDTSVYLLNSFNISLFEPCSDSSTQSGNYIGQWKSNGNAELYLEFTSDSVFIYQFDTVGCYRLSYLSCTDLGNSQLLISGLITTNYSLSDDNEVLNIIISTLGNLQLERTPFNVNDWEECTFDWKCVSFNCENVGLNNGTFNSLSSCQSLCIDTTSIDEYYNGIDIYPNPFREYTTLNFDDDVESYQLLDYSGRVLYDKKVRQPKEYLFKGKLCSGLYILQYKMKTSVYKHKLVIY